MREKKAAIGICDTCHGPIPRDLWYTSKGCIRLDCSIDCRNAANSRAGAAIRAEKARQRVQAGEWENPAEINPPDPQRVAAGIRRARKREVIEGRWRNPALDDQARAKLSKPRKHADDPVLHSAIEKLGHGVPMINLTPDERKAHREYRRSLRIARADESRAYYRQRYHERMRAAEGQVAEQVRWQRQRERLVQRQPNQRLINARMAAGLSQHQLAEQVGVSQNAVSHWEKFSQVPRDARVHAQVEQLLGPVW